MKITINEAIKILEHYNHGFCENSGGLSEPIKVAINIMRKYQKIEQIVKETHEGCITKYQKIEEVLEDGKID